MAFESGILGYDGVVSSSVFEGATFVAPSPNNIIPTDQPWGVRLEWTMSGANRPLIEALAPTSEFRLLVFLERIGPGTEISLPAVAAPVNIVSAADSTVGAAGRTYIKDLQFAAGSAPDGTYHLTSVVQLYNAPAPGGTPQAAAGFIELPMVLFFNP